MTDIDALNQCLAWLTAQVPLPAQVDGIVLCGNSQPATATIAGQLAQQWQLPMMIIAGGIGHATKYLRHNLHVTNNLSEAELMAASVRQTGYQGELRLDQTSTNTGSNATNALALVPQNWQHVLLIQDPLLSRRTELTFTKTWGTAYTLTRYVPQALQLAQLTPLQFSAPVPATKAWTSAYFTELLLGELQRLIDTSTGYGPRGMGFIPHVAVPDDVVAAYQFLQTQELTRKR